jgi:DNA-binding response OmpR family regulator
VSAPRVLLIEDEPVLVRGLSDALRSHGFDVKVATDGEQGLEAAISGQADLILLDVMLPKVDGYEICRAVRTHGIDAPIVMLTARSRERDVILGLNLGADDYVTKPFRVGELVARVRAFLRRRGPAPTTFTFGDCEVDVIARTVRRRGVAIDLTAKEFALLAYFGARVGCALSRDVILNAVWGTVVFVTPRSVDRCVTTLRSKVEPDPHRPIYIQTIREIGYRFDPNGTTGSATSSHPKGAGST